VKYVVSIADKTFEVVLNDHAVSINGKTVSVDLRDVPNSPLRTLVFDGKSTTYAMETGANGWSVMDTGEVHDLRVDDERAVALAKLAGTGERGGGGGKVKAPMPGLVLRVEVEEGEKVESGTGLVVLEAMKMENEIKAPISGIVKSVNVTGGQAVDKGMVLVEVVPEG